MRLARRAKKLRNRVLLLTFSLLVVLIYLVVVVPVTVFRWSRRSLVTHRHAT